MALAPQTDEASNDPSAQPLTGMERRMNIRAFDYWESLLAGRDFPSVGDLDPEAIAPFREHSLLIDFTNGYEAPVLRYVGSHLRAEASLANREIDPNDVPSGTLLSRLTNHYLEILANRSPIGFEAEYESSESERILYRGILLPLSDDGTTINFIYGVVSWKVEDILPGEDGSDDFDEDVLDLDAPVDPDDAELLELTQALDDAETDSLLTASDASEEEDGDLRALVSEIDAALGNTPDLQDSPEAGEVADDLIDLEDRQALDEDEALEQGISDQDTARDIESVLSGMDDDDYGTSEDVSEPNSEGLAERLSATLEADSAASDALTPEKSAAEDPTGEHPGADGPAMEETLTEDGVLDAALGAVGSDPDQELFDLLTLCQSKAADLARFDSRSRAALYETLSLGYDFHLVSQRKQEAYQDLLDKTGISVQARAPVTPIIKLIFGQGYDKTRVTEYASALGYADREGVPQGQFQDFVEGFEGGIKAMVKAERAARNAAKGNAAIDRLEAAKTALRVRPALMTVDANAVTSGVEGDDEFVLMVARKDSSGGYAVLDAVKTGKATLEAALKKVAATKRSAMDD